MPTPGTDELRTSRLSKFFNDVIYGRKTVTTAHHGRLFIEALCLQPDPAACVSEILSGGSGLNAIQVSLRFDNSVSFLNSHGSMLLQYLQEESLRTIGSGSVLSKVLCNVVEPPFFWDAYTKAFREGALDIDAFKSYAWLLFQLISLPGDWASLPPQLARMPDVLDMILTCSDGNVRNIGHKIKHTLPQDPTKNLVGADAQPGGRHDNDHVDYRKISIMPTADELLSQERAFFRTAEFLEDPENILSRSTMHVDNQFRLLREDMVGVIQDELKILGGLKHGHHKGMVIDKLRVRGIQANTGEKFIQPWGLRLEWDELLPQLRKLAPGKMTDYLKNDQHILRHGNMCCIMIDDEIAAFPTISRDVHQLVKQPSSIVVQFTDDSTLSSTLFKAIGASNIKLIQLDSAIFAFEPFLRRLQAIADLPLEEEVVTWQSGDAIATSPLKPSRILKGLEASAGKDVGRLLGIAKKVILDESQVASLCSCLSQRVSLVQGPPGTGKTFLGALAGKVLFDATDAVSLVMCFTNHALDQFLEDLMKVGIPDTDIVRLGSKGTHRTNPLRLRFQPPGKLTPTQWAETDRLKLRLAQHEKRLREAFKTYESANITKKQIMEYLEFASEDLPFFEAFAVPDESEDNMTRVGKRGKKVDSFYLLDRWIRNQTDEGIFKNKVQVEGSLPIWAMISTTRDFCMKRWRQAILSDIIHSIYESGRAFNSDQAELSRILAERDADVIKRKRIIGCTTNGAASHFSAIQAASPGIILVEEAGEILESHILTSLGPRTQQLILIGDHKLLRPKCSYPLSVVQGDGFDLNRSLFERLILRGFPHVTLTHQHRMRQEISCMVRELTYPDLRDATTTQSRPDFRGFTDNVMFVNHASLEVEVKKSKELRDGGTPSKQNEFEAQMILKCVRYLAQQGYGSKKMVVLTLYLGQLRLLRDKLAGDNDPILNDLDKFDLVKAGLLGDTNSRNSKPQLRLSTIARDALIMVGNAETFMHAKKGKEQWRKAFQLLEENGHIYNGFPIKCEKHPDRKATLSFPEDFELQCPDGGCIEPCGILLSCGKHKCPSSCHQIVDHSKMKCLALEQKQCHKGHKSTWRCHEHEPKSCRACEKERKEVERRAQEAGEEQIRQDEETRKHQAAVAKLDEDIRKLVQSVKDERIRNERIAIIAQKKQDLINRLANQFDFGVIFEVVLRLFGVVSRAGRQKKTL
ncbi:uncharacterized protein LY89DRAFT_667379 [Mollisia scopiformis]|uniref:NFX1-type zinc finger-containing protein 1 n=1 Tax=Mollisia scopiformis TaxID=149040 RepID=A0A194XH20_MOLSC|nr:uncharacterized protein LY89DRAFT_667379 [Mollisia scopiformis]KUJ19424.1 hypothetical protein LY89DRAFT_667379 [Mollisia scopiformis]